MDAAEAIVKRVVNDGRVGAGAYVSLEAAYNEVRGIIHNLGEFASSPAGGTALVNEGNQIFHETEISRAPKETVKAPNNFFSKNKRTSRVPVETKMFVKGSTWLLEQFIDPGLKTLDCIQRAMNAATQSARHAALGHPHTRVSEKKTTLAKENISGHLSNLAPSNKLAFIIKLNYSVD